MINVPRKKIEFEVQSIGKVLALNELTVGYRMECLDNKDKALPSNTLKIAGISDEDLKKLSVSEIHDIYQALLRLSYPDIDFDKPQTDVIDEEELKKNLN